MRGRAVDEGCLRRRQGPIPAPQHRAATVASGSGAGRLIGDLDDVAAGAGDARGQRIQQEALGETDGPGVTSQIASSTNSRRRARPAFQRLRHARCPDLSLRQPYLMPPR
jgi:hypothetical protein